MLLLFGAGTENSSSGWDGVRRRLDLTGDPRFWVRFESDRFILFDPFRLKVNREIREKSSGKVGFRVGEKGIREKELLICSSLLPLSTTSFGRGSCPALHGYEARRY